MTEDDAKNWLADRFGHNAVVKLSAFVDLLKAETERQNLVARSTLAEVWARHIVDSAQLLIHAADDWDSWIDIGSGAGLPGIVVTLLTEKPITLIEPRRLRVEFLNAAGKQLGLKNLLVVQSKAQSFRAPPASVISARAVAKLASILGESAGFASERTRFILPKGRGAETEVAEARRSWHGTFHVERSVVDAASGIVIAEGIRPR